MQKKAIQDFFKIMVGVLLLSSTLSFMLATSSSDQYGKGLLVGSLIAAIVSFMIDKARLITKICSDGIYVRYPPIQSTFSFFSWENIDQIYLRQYNPLREFGGWGIRMGPMGSAYIVSGNVGIQLIFKDGTKVLIGTNQPEAIATVLQRVGKLDFFIE